MRNLGTHLLESLTPSAEICKALSNKENHNFGEGLAHLFRQGSKKLRQQARVLVKPSTQNTST
jgi:hypothetical protein